MIIINEKASSVQDLIKDQMSKLNSINGTHGRINVYSGTKNYVIMNAGTDKFIINGGKGFDKYSDNKLNKMDREKGNQEYFSKSDASRYIEFLMKQLWSRKY